jgi:nucleotide-binding universal stress UspA family protein
VQAQSDKRAEGRTDSSDAIIDRSRGGTAVHAVTVTVTGQDRRIVVGVDSSHGSRVALGWALAQARRTGATVQAVTAWQDPAMYYAYGWAPDPYAAGGVAAITEKGLVRTIAEVVGTQDQPVDVRATIVEGASVQVLLTAAAGAELLVVGSRGHGAFAGMLLGSVSQHCVQHAPCPVVVVPDDRLDTEHTP